MGSMNSIRKSALMTLGMMMVPLVTQAAGIVSDVVTQTDSVVIQNTAEANVAATGRTDLYTGSYPNKFQVGTWTASVTSGTVAFKWGNQMTSITSDGLYASTINSTDNTKKVSLSINDPAVNTGPCNASVSQTVGGVLWRVCPQGITSVSSGFVLGGASTLTPGNYPISLDVAAFAY